MQLLTLQLLLRSTISQGRLNNLVMPSIQNDTAKTVGIENILRVFAEKNQKILFRKDLCIKSM